MPNNRLHHYGSPAAGEPRVRRDGIRAGADYNSGKEIHWREWCMLIPYVNIVFAIWNGIDGANGVTRADYASQYGGMFY